MIAPNIQQEILNLLIDLIRIPSTESRPDEIHRCSAFIASWLQKQGIKHKLEVHNSTPSLLVMPQKSKTRVLLMSHFDVVEVDNTSQFNPYEQDGRLYGRGSIDDKYAVALSLVLFREHLRRLERDGYSQDDICFGLLLTGDEEVGGTNGAGKIVNNLDTEYFIALDGGNPGHIVTKEKGVIALHLEARGKAAHAARPWLGKSAFDVLIGDYHRIQQLFTRQTDDHWHRTMVLANCHAGNGSTNIIPEQATATLNIRYTENDDPEKLVEEIKACTTSEVILDALDPVFDSGPSPYLDLLVKHSGGAGVGFEHGASDAKFFSINGIPGAIWGAQGNMSQHTENEHIEIKSLNMVYDCLEQFLMEIQLQQEIC
ncbi:M20 family metallopeptidase [Desulfopila sp. IMCC35008]|uniref:M20 family metallopeptidase n=1 Tax=Desulfopila sp. IMCC35008 TaxID=2653858 RepID=UPI0013D58965|nr:M20/M25/M40 family metallo-hydrolase [Desulfopila sp. IMCC35008]